MVTLVSASAVLAEPGVGREGHGGPRRGGPGHRPSSIVRALDADRNREVSAEELANASTAILTLDRNADGSVSGDELRPARPANAPERTAPPADAPARMRPVDPIMLALDADGDGRLAATEIGNAATSLAALDGNKDGKLTVDEIRPLPPESAPEGEGLRGARGPRD